MKIKLIQPARKPEWVGGTCRMRRPWDKIHKLEEKENYCFLKKLTLPKGFKILNDLYQIFYKIRNKKDIINLNLEKIRTLSRIHFTFNKVKL